MMLAKVELVSVNWKWGRGKVGGYPLGTALLLAVADQAKCSIDVLYSYKPLRMAIKALDRLSGILDKSLR